VQTENETADCFYLTLVIIKQTNEIVQKKRLIMKEKMTHFQNQD